MTGPHGFKEIWKVIVSKSGKLWKEIGQGQPQNDVYSLGVVLYELPGCKDCRCKGFRRTGIQGGGCLLG